MRQRRARREGAPARRPPQLPRTRAASGGRHSYEVRVERGPGAETVPLPASPPLLARRPARAAQQLRLPAVAVAQALDHPAAALRSVLTAGEELREPRPVLDPLQQDDLVVAARARRDRPAADHRDHAGLPRLREEYGAERIDVGLELAGEGPARVVQVERRPIHLARRGLGLEVDVRERRPVRRQEDLRRDLAPQRRDAPPPVPELRGARDEVAPGRPVADGGERHGLVARSRAVRELPEPKEPGLALLLDERPPDRAHRVAELLHLP